MLTFEEKHKLLVGKKFGPLTVLGYSGLLREGNRDLLWACRCACPKKTIVLVPTWRLMKKKRLACSRGRGCATNQPPRLKDLPLKKVRSPKGRDWVSFEVKNRNGLSHTITFDREDLPKVGHYLWHVGKHRYNFYVHSKESGTGPVVLMHRVILGLKRGDIREGDHWDGNGLNNTKRINGVGNIHVVSRSQNRENTSHRKRRAPLGVYPEGGKWVATAHIRGKTRRLGKFKTMKEAGEVAFEARKKHYRNFNPERVYRK